MNNVGIVGFEFVGKAVSQLSTVVNLQIYDPNNKNYNSTNNRVKAYNCDIIFINVPTNLKNGQLKIMALHLKRHTIVKR